MANTVLLKKSGVASRVPALSDLSLGEVALNYKDGFLYYRDNESSPAVNKLNAENANTADALSTTRNIALTGAVTGNINFDGSSNVSISTTATSDPTLTLSGDATGSATFTNLGNATLAVTVANDSHTHVASNITSGTFAAARIPSLAASKITSGTFGTARIPSLAASKITSGTFSGTRLGLATSTTRGAVKIGYSESGQNYPVELADEKMFVNVPWTDTNTNTTYTAGTHLALSGTQFNLNLGVADKVLNIGHPSTNNEGEIILDTSNGGSPQISFTDHGDASWAIGVDDADNGFKIHGNASATIPTINSLAVPLFEVSTSAGNAYVNGQKVFNDAYHPNADTLTTARNIALTGAVTGSASFNGSSNISITTTNTADPTLTINGDASGSATFTNLGNATLSLSLASDSVGSDEIAANAVGASEIAANAVGASEIAANAVGASEIAASAVGASELNVSGNGTITQFLRSDADGTFTWATPPDTDTVYTHPTHAGDDINIDTGALSGATVISDLDFNVTTDTLGHVTDANGAVSTRTLTLSDLGYTGATNANNYSLPAASASTRGGVKIGFTESGKNYPVEVSSEKMFVNVPWTDTNTDTNTFRTVTAGGNTLGATETLALTAGSNVSISEAGGQVTISSTDTNTVYSHPTHAGDDINIDTGALTGATVISDLDFNITTNTLGHVTDANGSVSTRTLTAANLGISAPNAPTSLSATIVGETIDLTFTASTTSNIDAYFVYSSVDGGDYGLIQVIPPDDFSATMSVIDSAFSVTGTQAYRVYATKYGILSTAGTASVSYTLGTIEPTSMSVINMNCAYYVQWDPPSLNDRFVSAYNVYKHEHATQGSLSRSSASLIYSGLNTNYMYQISGNNNNNFHQFWVETTIA